MYVNIVPQFQAFLDSIVVSISACHAEDPGSIPGRGVFFISFLIDNNCVSFVFVFIMCLTPIKVNVVKWYSTGCTIIQMSLYRLAQTILLQHFVTTCSPHKMNSVCL